MKILVLPLNGPKLLHPEVYADERGWSLESYSAETFEKLGLPAAFVLRYESQKEKAGTLRGIHFQDGPAAQAKLIQCTHGKLWDVAVDLRQGSPTFSRWTAVELSGDRPEMLYLPAGFGHAFMTLEDRTRIVYLMDRPFRPSYARRIAWNDPAIGISWPALPPILSEKDRCAPKLEQCEIHFDTGAMT